MHHEHSPHCEHNHPPLEDIQLQALGSLCASGQCAHAGHNPSASFNEGYLGQQIDTEIMLAASQATEVKQAETKKPETKKSKKKKRQFGTLARLLLTEATA